MQTVAVLVQVADGDIGAAMGSHDDVAAGAEVGVDVTRDYEVELVDDLRVCLPRVRAGGPLLGIDDDASVDSLAAELPKCSIRLDVEASVAVVPEDRLLNPCEHVGI